MSRAVRLALGASVAGGLIAAAGTFLTWARITAISGPATIGGLDIPLSSQSRSAAGTEHWTGLAVLACGLIAAGASAGFGGRRARAALLVSAMAGLGAFGGSLAGYAWRREVVRAAAPEFLEGLSQVGRFGASIGVPVAVEVTAGPGLVESAAGGLVVSAAAALGLSRSRREEAAEAPPP